METIDLPDIRSDSLKRLPIDERTDVVARYMIGVMKLAGLNAGAICDLMTTSIYLAQGDEALKLDMARKGIEIDGGDVRRRVLAILAH